MLNINVRLGSFLLQLAEVDMTKERFVSYTGNVSKNFHALF